LIRFYEALFEALVFTIKACGYRVGCGRKVIGIVRSYLDLRHAANPCLDASRSSKPSTSSRKSFWPLLGTSSTELMKIDGLKNYRTFIWCVAAFLKRAEQRGS
jgi:hypothetical protein